MMAGVIAQAGIPRPPNSRFANAILLVDGVPYEGNNRGSFLEADETVPESVFDTSRSVWFYYIAGADGTINVAVDMADTYGALLGAFTGTALDNLVLVALDADDNTAASGLQTASIDIAVTSGTTYFFAVYGFPTLSGESGLFRGASPYTILLTETEVVADDPVGTADFVMGAYAYDGDPLAAGDVIDLPGDIVSGVGLVTNGRFVTDSTAVAILGDFLAHLLTGSWTIVIEWHRCEDVALPLAIGDATFETGARMGVEDSTSLGGYFLAYDGLDPDPGSSIERDLELDALDSGAHCLALTRTNALLAISVDGGLVSSSVVTQHAFSSIPLTNAWFGGDEGFSFGQIVIGRLDIYPPQDNALLPTLSVVSALQHPANDLFANAIALTVDVPETGHNFVARAEVGEPNLDGNSGGHLVWWSFTAPSTAAYIVNLDGTDSMADFGVAAGIYTGTEVDDLTQVAVGADFPSGPSITFSGTSGVTYYIAVDGWGGGEGNINIVVTEDAAPTTAGEPLGLLLALTKAT